ncbi:GIY-YIG nuclease family protein [Streptomyces sp. 5.8]|uniref:GIY-YIG nuclease family protein n=1 Tax=Streptomyces sp. 5.8 TaxID=3406571 RepID=UPI003BB61DC9
MPDSTTSSVYLIGPRTRGPVKIGYTARRPEDRLKVLQTGHPEKLHVLWSTPGTELLEAALHSRFHLYRVQGEWFDFGALDPIETVRNAVFGKREATKAEPMPVVRIRGGYLASHVKYWKQSDFEQRFIEVFWRFWDLLFVAAAVQVSVDYLHAMEWDDWVLGWWGDLKVWITSYDFTSVDVIAAASMFFVCRVLQPYASRLLSGLVGVIRYFVRRPHPISVPVLPTR